MLRATRKPHHVLLQERMAHWVKRKNKYWSLEESYRNAQGKPRKRILQYLGVPPIDWAYTLKGDGASADIEALAQPKGGEVIDNLPPGLLVGPTDPTPVDPTPCAPESGDTPDVSTE